MFRFQNKLQRNRVSHKRSPGFTLVELLVVIVIIAILAALITPAVVGALSAARRTAISQEIATMDGALKNYKNAYGSYPPSNGYEFRNHLKRIFIYGSADIEPTPAANNSNIIPGNSPAVLTDLRGPEILVYCLGGYMSPTNATNFTFSSDKRLPLSGTSKKPALFDFDQNRLVTFSSPSSPVSPVTKPASATSYTFPVYMPPYPSTRTAPYVYFCTSRPSSYSEFYQVPAATAGQYGTFRPYAVVNGAGAPVVANATSFQIICAGEDGNAGAAVAAASESSFGSGNISTVNNQLRLPGYGSTAVKYCRIFVNGSYADGTATNYYYDAPTEDDNMSNVFGNRLEDNKP